MTSLSNTSLEKIIPYQYFENGGVTDWMPELLKKGYDPMGANVIIDRRQNAPEEVRSEYNFFFWTADSCVTTQEGGVLLTLDSSVLRELTPKSQLVDGGLKLGREAWDKLVADKEHTLYLTPQELETVHEKVYVLKNGKFIPANKAVAKAWEHLNRGRDLQNYAQMVSEASKSNNIMQLYFDRPKPGTDYRQEYKPRAFILRSLVIDHLFLSSLILANRNDSLFRE